MKVIVNRCFGGFSVSKEVYDELGLEWDKYGSLSTYKDYGYGEDMLRADEDLVFAVEKLGKKADGEYARLEIVEIPDDIEWEIYEYDGAETIHEKHNSW